MTQRGLGIIHEVNGISLDEITDLHHICADNLEATIFVLVMKIKQLLVKLVRITRTPNTYAFLVVLFYLVFDLKPNTPKCEYSKETFCCIFSSASHSCST